MQICGRRKRLFFKVSKFALRLSQHPIQWVPWGHMGCGEELVPCSSASRLKVCLELWFYSSLRLHCMHNNECLTHFNFCLIYSTGGPHDKEQPVDVLCGSNCCVFWEWNGKLKHTVLAKCSVSKRYGKWYLEIPLSNSHTSCSITDEARTIFFLAECKALWRSMQQVIY